MSVEETISTTTKYLESTIFDHARAANERNAPSALGPSYAETNATRLRVALSEFADGRPITAEEIRNRLVIDMFAPLSAEERGVLAERLSRLMSSAGNESRTALPSDAERSENSSRIAELVREARDDVSLIGPREELVWRLARKEVWDTVLQTQERERNESREQDPATLNELGDPGADRSRVNMFPQSSSNSPESDVIRDPSVSNASVLVRARGQLLELAERDSVDPQVKASVLELAEHVRGMEREMFGAVDEVKRSELWAGLESKLAQLGPEVTKRHRELRDLNRLARRGGVPGLSTRDAFGVTDRSREERDRGREVAGRSLGM